MDKPITHISYLITEDCNFRCEYCFYKQNPKETDFKTAKKVIDWLDNQPDKSNDRHVQFFGGEPLMRWDLMVQVVKYAKTKNNNFRFGVTTNGSLLDEEKFDFCEEENIGLLFSTDGIEEAQNTHRKDVNGKGTFHLIEDNMREAVKRGIAPTARLTYTPDTVQYLYDSVTFLLDDIGFGNVAPTPAIDSYNPFEKEDYEEWDRQYEKLNERLKKKVINGENPGMSYHRKCFRQMLRDDNMKSPCGAGKKFVGVNWKGELFPCHRFVQWPEWKLGDVWNGITNNEKREKTAKFSHIKSNEKCAECDNGFCGGTCLAAKYEENKDINEPTETGCILSKNQWDNAVDMFENMKKNGRFVEAFPELVKKHDVNNIFGLSDQKQEPKTKQKTYNHNKRPTNIGDVYKKVNQIDERLQKLENLIIKLAKAQLTDLK
jgi:uncharacterized protein